MASAVASQCRLANTCRVARASRNTARRAVLPVRAVAAKETSAVQKKLTAAVLSAAPALFLASPALALVDDRLGGDGVGYSLGINDPVLFWVIFVVFLGVWGAYFSSQKDLGEFEDEDSGLSL